ncbi:MAG: proteasome assembly chaperone family protein [Halobacteriaceae archaeon]
MADASSGDVSFQITHESTPSERLVAGFSSFGLAGLTAVDFLVDQLELKETGHISIDQLPPITPFEEGTPRHHTRLFSRSDLDVTLLVNELFIPLQYTDQLGNAILGWTESNAVQEITVLAGVPVPHGPESHQVYYIATRDYQAATLQDAEISPMGDGFLDGINASLIGQGMDSELRVGVFVTPVHAQVPDVEAALRLVQAFEQLFEVDVNTDELEQFAAEVERYYQDLEDRLRSMEPSETPEDRMYM